MSMRYPFLLAVGMLGMWVSMLQGVVPTESMARLRQETQTAASLTDPQIEQIDKFWQASLDQMLLTEDSATISQLAQNLVQEKGAADTAFGKAYLQAAKKHLAQAFQTIANWQPSERKRQVVLNLTIVLAQMQSAELLELSLPLLSHPDAAVRYWAVRVVCQAPIASAIATKPAVQADLFKALQAAVAQETQADVLRAMVSFAAMVNTDPAAQLLAAILDKRIAAYQSWNVANESFDGFLLKTVGMQILAEQPSARRSMLAQKFATLYAMVFQRYMAEPSPLTDAQRNALLTVIAEVDNQVLTRVMDNQPTSILRSIRQPMWRQALERDYETFFGNSARAGELALRWQFDYGKTADGKPITAPPRLPAPPSK